MPRFTFAQQTIIDQLQRELDIIEKTWPMTSNYARLDPYIVPYIQDKKHFELIIYHFESCSWFDAAPTDFIITQTSTSKLVGPKDVVFDIGCNAGAVTVPLAAMCADGGHVHAFDPYPWNAVSTRCNARLNGLTNVTAHAVGLSNRDSTIAVNPNDARIFEKSSEANAQTLVIHDIRRYAHLAPSFLKIDIEGSEHDLFEDHDPQMLPSVKSFVLEFHPFWIAPRGIDPKISLRGIEKSGFDLHYYNLDMPKFDVDTYTDNLHLFWGRRPS
jgi:FkbM family methyltransferase